MIISKKTKLAIATAILLLLTVMFALGIPVAAETQGIFTYTVSDSGAEISSVDKSVTGAVVIPETLGGKPVISIKNDAFRDCTGMTDITFPSSLVSIGSNAFAGCTSLTEITLPEKLQGIGSSAFAGCYYVTTLNINSVSLYGLSAYTEAFRDLGKETAGVTVNIGAKVEWIPERIFLCDSWERPNLKSVVFAPGSACTRIGYSAFEGISTLKSINLPSELTTIDSYAFNGCSGITEITLPEKLQSLGSGAFAGCHSVTTLNINSVSLYGLSTYTEAFRDLGKEAAGVTVNIGAKVEWIPERIFLCDAGERPNLKSVVFAPGSACTKIGYSAFEGISTLENINLPAGLVTIDGSAFKDCSSLKKVEFGEKTDVIGYDAFFNCASITEITLPENLKSVGDGAFAGCKAIKTINLNSISLNTLGSLSESFSYVGKDTDGTTINIGAKVEWIPNHMFHSYNEECPNIVKIVFAQNSVCTKIGYNAFEGLYNLKSVNLPSEINTVDSYAFRGCTSLTEITLPEKLQNIGSEAFGGCSALTQINLNSVALNRLSSYTSLFRGAGHSGAGITLNIASGVTKIPAYFLHTGDENARPKVTKVVFENGSVCTTIEDGAFRDLRFLEKLVLPSSITNIGFEAFGYCVSLRELVFTGNAPSFNNIAFNGTTVIAYYPFMNETYTPAVKQNYGGTITWVMSEHEHTYSDKLTEGETSHYYGCLYCDLKKDEAPHSYKSPTSNGDNTHTSTCVCGKEHKEACLGGEANCKDRAVCSECKAAYGTTDLTKHNYSSTLIQGESTHYYSCSICEGKKDEAIHDYKNAVSNGNGTHSGKCVCGKNDTVACFGGTATCKEAAVCDVCDTKYGTVNTNNHAYGVKLTEGESTHYYLCERCGDKKNETPHAFGGFVTNGDGTHTGSCACGKRSSAPCSGGTATCLAPAACTACGSPYGTVKSHEYDLTKWGYKGADGHAHICKIVGCNAHDTVVPHVSSGAATEQSAELCTACQYIITPALGHTHTPSSSWSNNSTHHWKPCSGCGGQEYEKGEHVYDNACDTTCNTCGYIRTVTHRYALKQSAAEHWQACEVCGDEKAGSRASHRSSGQATDQNAEVCLDCGYEISPMLGHTHSISSAWTSDASGHWKTCSGCSDVFEKTEHTYDRACDENCNSCGYVREARHQYGNLRQDINEHWYVCDCGMEKANSREPHYGGIATCTSGAKCSLCYETYTSASHSWGAWQINDEIHRRECPACGARNEAGHRFNEDVCVVCDYVKGAGSQTGTGETNTPDPSETGANDGSSSSDKPDDKDPSDNDGAFDPTLIIIIVIAVAVLAAGGITAFLIIKKKK